MGSIDRWKIHRASETRHIGISCEVYRDTDPAVIIAAAKVSQINKPGTIRSQLSDERISISSGRWLHGTHGGQVRFFGIAGDIGATRRVYSNGCHRGAANAAETGIKVSGEDRRPVGIQLCQHFGRAEERLRPDAARHPGIARPIHGHSVDQTLTQASLVHQHRVDHQWLCGIIRSSPKANLPSMDGIPAGDLASNAVDVLV